MKYVGITKRWLLNVASIVIAILVCVSLLLFFLLRTYYYGGAKMTIESVSADELSTVFKLYGASNSGFKAAARDYVESYPNKDTVAVWGIDNKGRVFISSGGFSIDEDVEMPDYDMALQSETGSARWTGRLPSGEKIMASTCAYYYSNGANAGAIRFMVSMDAVDDQLTFLALLIFAVAMLMFIILYISGMSFVRSIVNPVKEIGQTAKEIAGGDLKAKIDHYPYNDEIGELCTTINDMADKLNENDRMKNDFISTVSHELRTPLTAIRGWGETLRDLGNSDPDMTDRGMGVIISEAGRLNDMVEELLDFSRINSGRMKLNIKPIDFLAELDEVVFSFRDRTAREGIEVDYDIPYTPAIGNGDDGRIKQVFINIIDNAIKYTDRGGKITIRASFPETEKLKVEISDTGCGIPAEDLPHIKEKFYKANSTVRGSGIGLAVVDEIIRLHNGQIDIDSVYGEGTEVSITLPLESHKNSGEK